MTEGSFLLYLMHPQSRAEYQPIGHMESEVGKLMDDALQREEEEEAPNEEEDEEEDEEEPVSDS
jgi:hypothetical protein